MKSKYQERTDQSIEERVIYIKIVIYYRSYSIYESMENTSAKYHSYCMLAVDTLYCQSDINYCRITEHPLMH